MALGQPGARDLLPWKQRSEVGWSVRAQEGTGREGKVRLSEEGEERTVCAKKGCVASMAPSENCSSSPEVPEEGCCALGRASWGSRWRRGLVPRLRSWILHGRICSSGLGRWIEGWVEWGAAWKQGFRRVRRRVNRTGGG